MDDLLDLLGVTLPPPVSKKALGERKGPTPPDRMTAWSDSRTFDFGGYLAKVVRHRCKTCEGQTEVLVGIFIEERHTRTGTRRLTQLSKGSQWPTGEEHRLELTEEAVPVCALCVRLLGFSREIPAPGNYSLVVKE